MDGVSLENLFALQQMSSAPGLTSSGSASDTGNAFAQLLAEELGEIGGSASGTASTADLEKEMMLNMYLMMCSGNMSSSPAMESMLSMLSGNLSSDSSSASTGQSIVDAALTRLGDPYSKTYRGTGDYVDCSYLAQWAYKQAGISIPGTAAAQAKYCYDNGYTISKDHLQPGDLVFWTEKGSGTRWHEIHHVGIYAGNGKVVEAKGTKKGVELDDLWESGKWQIVMYARPYAKGADSVST